ncbi:MAG: DNA gyrase inhibitor YacG [Nannocystales bacterium]
MQRKCPTCGSSFEFDPASKWRPFCTRRCKLVDLGNWMDGVYRISRPLGMEDLEDDETLLSQLTADAAAEREPQ